MDFDKVTDELMEMLEVGGHDLQFKLSCIGFLNAITDSPITRGFFTGISRGNHSLDPHFAIFTFRNPGTLDPDNPISRNPVHFEFHPKPLAVLLRTSRLGSKVREFYYDKQDGVLSVDDFYTLLHLVRKSIRHGGADMFFDPHLGPLVSG